MIKKLPKIKYVIVTVCIIAAMAYLKFQKYPFSDSYSQVLTDSAGNLFDIRIALDGQWRFPQTEKIPEKFEKCIIQYEDKHFYSHHGVDFLSLIRAAYKDIRARKIVSGGSTITMQTVRLWRKEKRTFTEKFIEILAAIRLETSYSKQEILAMYAAHAPFGGNTVGLETAAYRYFGRKADRLSWAETAMLAVLPNNPSLVNLAKNREYLKEKRDILLKKLYYNKIIDRETCLISLDEEIPPHPYPSPLLAPHLLTRCIKEDKKNNLHVTTLDYNLQIQSTEILNRHMKKLSASGIENGAILILEVSTGKTLAYVGNWSAPQKETESSFNVDIITSPRSTGSVLKPFLYAAMLNEGSILPNSIVADIPMQISGYMPKNYRLTYDGAVSADKALARSLNVPAVKMLQTYGSEKFINTLHKLGLKSVNKSADYYGLSLILGGCESNLWQLCGAYASMARCLYNYQINNNLYNKNDWHSPYFLCDKKPKAPRKELENNSDIFSAASIWYTLEALKQVERPEEENGNEFFQNNREVAWKTGTSFGFRDAWAIGITGNYVVGVWTGNADGEGRAGLIGIEASAPILFDVVNILPYSKGNFPIPIDELQSVDICTKSGYIAGENCNDVEKRQIPAVGINFQTCPYCKIIHLDKSLTYRVSSNCENINNIVTQKWFILPPAMEYYYKQKNTWYKPLPPMREDCLQSNGDNFKSMQIIYPDNGAKIYLPIGADGNRSKLIVEVAVRNNKSKLYWHLDNKYVGTTERYHKLDISPSNGWHKITITDQDGNQTSGNFYILEPKK